VETDRPNLNISADAALVLFEMLTRSSSAVQPLHPGEQEALWELEAALERVLAHPLNADYEQVVSAARGRLLDGCGDVTMPKRICYVDVDDTLVRSFGSKRIPIVAAVTRVRELHAAGAELYCWSSGGAAYALSSANELGLESCFAAYLPKPQLMLDDQSPAEWRDLVCVHPNVVASQSADELLAQSVPGSGRAP
jgi:hypothetical protein